MTPEEKQSELNRHRDILLAAIDYLIKWTVGSVKFDEFDPGAEHYQKLKRQTEENYQQHRLDRLKQKLSSLVEMPQQRGDLGFGRYIKEKTGYDIDIFENIQKRTDEIIEQKRIKSKHEYSDVVAMMSLCAQPPVDPEKIYILSTLLTDFNDLKSKRESSGKNIYPTKELSESWSPDHQCKLSVTENGKDENYAVTGVVIYFEQGSGGIYAARGMNLDIKAYWKDNSTIVIETKKDYTVITRCKKVQNFQDIIRIEYIESYPG